MSQAPGLRQARESDLLAIVALYADDRLGAQREKVGETVHENYLNAFKEIKKILITRFMSR